MQLTPFADGLRELVRRVLQQIEDVSVFRETFDPAGVSRACVIAARDLTLSLLAPSLLRRFSAEAPNATLKITSLNGRTSDISKRRRQLFGLRECSSSAFSATLLLRLRDLRTVVVLPETSSA
jgi:DNA-binding transcriptional LysR family regulator